MNVLFDAMLKKRPNRSIRGDYYYRIPWIEEERQKYGSWTESEEESERKEQYGRDSFLAHYHSRTLDGREFWMTAPVLRLMKELASSEPPVVDLCSSERMGMLPYLLQLNPRLHCLAQDVDEYALARLRRRLDEFLPELDVSLASFDNLDLPFADNAVPCITGSGFVTHCGMNRNFSCPPDVETLEAFRAASDAFFASLEQRAMEEVYRVLQPGGWVFLEDDAGEEWVCDAEKLERFFDGQGLLYGLYPRETVWAKIREQEEKRKKAVSMEERLLDAGFKAVRIEYGREKVAVSQAARHFSESGDPVDLADPCPGADLVEIYCKSGMYILTK